MGRDTAMIALDSNTMTYWIDAMSSVTGPPSDPHSAEKIALSRIFFWMPDESCFHYMPTMEAEYRAISDRAKLDNHIRWAISHISPVMPPPHPDAVKARASEFLEDHRKGEKDRTMLAECELTEIQTLLTCDTDFLKRLRAKARVRLCLPSEYWEWMAVPRGTRPNQKPAPGNPLLDCRWWHWT